MSANRCQFELNDEFINKSEVETVKTSRIYLAAITANISAIAAGICMTWSSPIGPKLRSQDTSDSPFSRPINTNEDAWISSTIAIGALIAPFIAGPLADRIGRKKVLLSSSLFFIIGFIFMLIAKDVWVMLLGRLIKGFGIGFVMCVSPMYVSEISNVETRGSTGSLMSLLIACGLAYALCIGPFVSYIWLQYFCLLVPVVFFVAFIFMPDSPFYYVAKGQRLAASKSLQFLRGQSPAAVEAELISIENMLAASMAQKSSLLDIFKTSGNRKALFIALGLVFFQQVSGINAVLFNAQTIFESAHMNIDLAIATIIVCILQVLSAAFTPFVATKFGRKSILQTSAICMSIGLAALGYFFFSQIVIDDITGITWLPVPSLILYITAFTMGFGPMPWTVLSEIFPPNVKSIAAALSSSACWIFGFFVALLYPALASLGTFYVFWLFAAFSALAFFFVLFIVLETKDLSLDEIQNRLNNKH